MALDEKLMQEAIEWRRKIDADPDVVLTPEFREWIITNAQWFSDNQREITEDERWRKPISTR